MITSDTYIESDSQLSFPTMGSSKVMGFAFLVLLLLDLSFAARILKEYGADGGGEGGGGEEGGGGGGGSAVGAGSGYGSGSGSGYGGADGHGYASGGGGGGGSGGGGGGGRGGAAGSGGGKGGGRGGGSGSGSGLRISDRDGNVLETGEVNTPSNREQRYAATDLIFLFDHKAEFIQIV